MLEVFRYYFFKYSPSSSGTPIMHMLVCLMVSHGSLSSVSLPSIFFLSIPQTWWFPLYYLQSCWFFLLPTHICLWIRLVNFSFSLLYFSASEFLFRFSLSLLIFPFCLCIVFFTFSTFFFSYLNIFKTAVLKYLSSISSIKGFFSRTVSVYFFIPFEWATLSYFFVCLGIQSSKILLRTEYLNLIMSTRLSPSPCYFLLLFLFIIFILLVIVGCLCA